MSSNVFYSTKYPRPGKLDLTLDPAKCVLVVIDMQNGFAHDEGSFGKHGRDISLAKNAISKIKEAISYCHDKNIPVIYTQQISVPEHSAAQLRQIIGRENIENLAKIHVCLKNTWDAEIVDELKPTKIDYVVEKNKPSAFYNTWFELWLRYFKVDTLLITGCNTGNCISHTAWDAYARDYNIISIEDGVGDVDPFIHEVLLELIDRRLGRVLKWNIVRETLEKYPDTLTIDGYRDEGYKILAESEKTYTRKVK